MTDTVDTVIELPVGAIVPTASPSSRLVVLPADGAGAHRTVDDSDCRRAAAVVDGRTRSPPIDQRDPLPRRTERLRHQPADRQQSRRLTAA